MAQTSVIFSATDATNGQEPWITDGTPGGTRLIKDIFPGGGPSFPTDFTPLGNGQAVFRVSIYKELVGFFSEEWVTDGTAAGTTRLASLGRDTNDATPHAALGNGRAAFEASHTGGGRDLWVTDGTPAGTQNLLKYTGITSAVAPVTAVGNGRAVFAAPEVLTDSNGSYAVGRLWSTDGTAAGTTVVATFRNSNSTGLPSEFTAVGGKLVFGADTAGDGVEPWVTDGTVAGTMQLKSINPGVGSSLPHSFAKLGDGKLMFQAETGPNEGLWITDGTTAGTTLVVGSLYASQITSLADGTVAFFGYPVGSTAGVSNPMLV